MLCEANQTYIPLDFKAPEHQQMIDSVSVVFAPLSAEENSAD